MQEIRYDLEEAAAAIEHFETKNGEETNQYLVVGISKISPEGVEGFITSQVKLYKVKLFAFI